jgi:1-deoxy-D-xylulose-5-phosphate synthase
MRAVPGMVCMAPKDEAELRDLLATALTIESGPSMVRFPRGSGPGTPLREGFRILPVGSWELLRDGRDAALLACGAMVSVAVEAAEILARRGVEVAVVNCRFVKPMDEEMLVSLARRLGRLVTLEDNVLHGGFGSGVLEVLAERGLEVPVRRFGLPDAFVTHGSREELFRMLGLDAPAVAAALALTLAPAVSHADRGA